MLLVTLESDYSYRDNNGYLCVRCTLLRTQIGGLPSLGLLGFDGLLAR